MTGAAHPLEHVFITTINDPPAGTRLAVKDIFDTAGIRTTYGSLVFEHHVPDASAEAVVRLEGSAYAAAEPPLDPPAMRPGAIGFGTVP